ncbi:MAG: TolC family protein [Treponema sp.]|nr:TolC family protein [Treponema sp.]
MIFKRLATLTFCAFIVAAAVTAQDIALTIDDAVQYASENNISIAQSKITLDALKRTKNYSWNSISPSLSLGGNMMFPLDEDARKAQYDYSMSFTGAINITLSPSIYSSIQTAVLNYQNGLLAYDEAKRQIELNVRIAFYHLLYEQEYIAQQERNMQTAEQQYNQNRRKYESGQLSELDMLSSQVAYERLKPTLEAAEITYKNDMALFKQTLGIDQAVAVALTGSLDDALLLDDIIAELSAENTPSVQSAENNVKIAKATLTARRLAAWGPTVSAGWSYGKSKLKPSDTVSTTNAFSISVSIPLDGYLPWSQGGQSASSAKDSVKNAELALEKQKTTVAVQIENYLNQIKLGQSQLASLQANVDLAQRSYEMTQRAYNAGSRDFLTLQTASDALLSARVSLAQQQYTLITAVFNLEYVLGVPFGSFGKNAAD